MISTLNAAALKIDIENVAMKRNKNEIIMQKKREREGEAAEEEEKKNVKDYYWMILKIIFEIQNIFKLNFLHLRSFNDSTILAVN